MSKSRLLFLATHPKEVASTRYRVLAYSSALRKAGFEFEVQTFFSSEALGLLYESGRWDRQTTTTVQGAWARWRKLRTSDVDLIFIHRELFPWGMSAGMALLMPQLKNLQCPIIYDFDDAIYLFHRQQHPFLWRFENPRSVDKLVELSDQIIVGNIHLARYAERFNSHVEHIPTPVDTNRFFPSETSRRTTAPCTIGWIGSPSTAKYLTSLLPLFERLAQRHTFCLKVVGAGYPIHLRGVSVDQRPWSLSAETEEFRSCDIGVYPLWDDEWSLGKCGFKALQFMASGVPVVASAVGVNTQIIQNGVNGLLAGTSEEWVDLLAALIDQPDLRRQLRMTGRVTVEEKYSLSILAPRFIETLQSTLERRKPKRRKSSRGDRHPSDLKLLDLETKTVVGEQQTILCFSSIDWDFVWQGHQEIMATLARQGHHVLFIENTGVRNPRFNDLPRIQHRFNRWRRSLQGFHREGENLYIFSPLVLPFPYSRVALWINCRLLLSAIRRWMYLMDFYQPVCWVFLPTPITLEAIQKIHSKVLVYYCIDSFVDSTPAAQRIVTSEDKFLERSDLVFVTSQRLLERASQRNLNVHFFPFGVNFKIFEKIRDSDQGPPEDIRHLKRPIVGYVGGVHRWLNQELLCFLARACPQYTFVMIGPIQTEIGLLRREKNVVCLGQRLHEQLPLYLKYFDVGIIPYHLTEYTKNVYPTKLNEYHAMGKPVVSTPLPEVVAFNRRYPNLVKIGETEIEFHRAIEQVLQEDNADLRERRIQSAKDNSWDQRIDQMQDLTRQVIARKGLQHTEYWSSRFVASQRSIRFFSRMILGCGLLYGAIFHTPLVWFLARPLVVSNQPQRADAIVVFGGGVGESGEVSEGYQNRVKQAVEMYREGYAPNILYVSGYTWMFQEADIMRMLTEFLKVPSDSILVEKRVSSTYDYVLRVKEIAAHRGWKSILVITPAYHTQRTSLTFARNVPELKVSYIPARTGYYAHNWGMRPYQLGSILHEILGMFFYWLRGWL